MVSPTFGGKTALVEFELLTGNSMAFLPKGSVPYQQYLQSPVPALPWEFKKNGYRTVAVHTYDKNFFNRANAYPLLGFDRFVGKDDIREVEYKGPFISDKTFTDEILRQLRDDGRKEPLFLFGISMENHFSYEGHKFDELDVSVSGSGLSSEDVRTVTNYAQGIRDADRELGRLVEELRKFDEPTYLLFFGDHLGILGENFGAYVRSGFLSSSKESEWSEKERLSLYSPPFVVWNNFAERSGSGTTAKPEPRNFGYVRSPFLGNLLLDLLGAKDKDPRFDFLTSVAPCFSKPSAELSDSIPPSHAYAEKCGDAIRNFAILQYATLFDKKDRR